VEKVKIRRANYEDKLHLLDLLQHYKPEEVLKNRIECYLSHNHTSIAQYDENIVGIVQWHIKEDPNLGVVEIEEVYVREKHRHKGIGSALMEFSLKSIKEYYNSLKIKLRRLLLFVDENNVIARKMYEKMGFRLVSDVGDLFFDGEKELIYVLSFGN